MKEGEEYFKETRPHSFPTHAKIVKGIFVNHPDKVAFTNQWCRIEEIQMANGRDEYKSQMILEHPKFGLIYWVDLEDCIFGVKKVFRTTK
jgi:hypothetical protein